MSDRSQSYQEQRKALYERSLVLEYQIQNNTDEKILSALRKEYREITDKLEAFYNDERDMKL